MSTRQQELVKAAATFAGLIKDIQPDTSSVSISIARWRGEETVLTTISVTENVLECEP